MADTVIIDNALTLYDNTIIKPLRELRFVSVPNARWIFGPSDIALRLAKDAYGEEIFPLYSVFRSDPSIEADNHSLPNYRKYISINNNQEIHPLLVNLVYQVDFWSRDMYEMNKSNIDWFNFKKDRLLPFDFTKLGLTQLTGDYTAHVRFDDPVSDGTLSEMYDVGRYFRYTYTVILETLIFDILEAVEFKTLCFGVYSPNVSDNNKYFEEIYDVNP